MGGVLGAMNQPTLGRLVNPSPWMSAGLLACISLAAMDGCNAASDRAGSAGPVVPPVSSTSTATPTVASGGSRTPEPTASASSAAATVAAGLQEPEIVVSPNGNVTVHVEQDATDPSLENVWIKQGDAGATILVRGRDTATVYPMAGSGFERLSFTSDSRTLVFQTQAYGASPGVWAFDVPTGKELWHATLFFGGMIKDGPYKDFVLVGFNHSDGTGIHAMVERARDQASKRQISEDEERELSRQIKSGTH